MATAASGAKHLLSLLRPPLQWALLARRRALLDTRSDSGPAEPMAPRRGLVALNSLRDGRAVQDGILRYWLDGNLLIDQSDAVLRTGRHPDMQFDQLLIGPYIGDGSPLIRLSGLTSFSLPTDRMDPGPLAPATAQMASDTSPPK